MFRQWHPLSVAAHVVMHARSLSRVEIISPLPGAPVQLFFFSILPCTLLSFTEKIRATPTNQYLVQMSEDCLHVVVYVPSKLTKQVDTREGHYYTLVDDVTSADLPVMVFFHGGAFMTGGNGVTLYDGRFIAEKGGVIVVTVNYRCLTVVSKHSSFQVCKSSS